MIEHRITLIGGGVRSGKSGFAVELAASAGARRAFVATARGSDDEMRARIARHQRDRGADFAVLREEPIELAAALASLADVDVVVVDCLTLWLSNLLLRGDAAEAILAQVSDVIEVLRARRFHAIVVTNEVGMSVHPPTPLGRAFVEVCGWAHQRLAREADDLYLAVLGAIVRLDPVARRPLGGA